MTEVKTLAQMRDEVEAYCRDKGWWDEEVPFSVAMALLHEEAAEAGHAWRDHGLADMTLAQVTVPLGEIAPPPPKPEGVGSEFADILIRMLDDDARYKMGLEEYLEPAPEIFALDDHFLVNINTLHGLIAQVTTATETCYESPHDAFAAILSFLRQLCMSYGIDLMAEYEKKMAYNRTRAYRHGGRRA
jgi:NTP pyrophosphatase (non-canonical NTP hydrolase)